MKRALFIPKGTKATVVQNGAVTEYTDVAVMLSDIYAGKIDLDKAVITMLGVTVSVTKDPPSPPKVWVDGLTKPREKKESPAKEPVE